MLSRSMASLAFAGSLPPCPLKLHLKAWRFSTATSTVSPNSPDGLFGGYRDAGPFVEHAGYNCLKSVLVSKVMRNNPNMNMSYLRSAGSVTYQTLHDCWPKMSCMVSCLSSGVVDTDKIDTTNAQRVEQLVTEVVHTLFAFFIVSSVIDAQVLRSVVQGKMSRWIQLEPADSQLEHCLMNGFAIWRRHGFSLKWIRFFWCSSRRYVRF